MKKVVLVYLKDYEDVVKDFPLLMNAWGFCVVAIAWDETRFMEEIKNADLVFVYDTGSVIAPTVLNLCGGNISILILYTGTRPETRQKNVRSMLVPTDPRDIEKTMKRLTRRRKGVKNASYFF